MQSDQNHSDEIEDLERNAQKLLERKIYRGQMAFFFERLWPRFWLPFSVASLFVFVSLAGLWAVIPLWAHKLILGLFGFGFVASCIPLLRCPWPDRQETLKRLERYSGLKHHPASAFEDSLNEAASSRTTKRLWQAHREQLRKSIPDLKNELPKPRTDVLDPYALRIPLVFGMFLIFLFAGNIALERLGGAFELAGKSEAALGLRLDAWITPPSYTAKAPIVLRNGNDALKVDEQVRRIIKAPQNSILTIRLGGPNSKDYKVLVSNQKTETEGFRSLKAKKSGQQDNEEEEIVVRQFSMKLTSAFHIKIMEGNRELYAWRIHTDADLPPRVTLLRPIGKTVRNALQLDYVVSDDYGVASGRAFISQSAPGARTQKKGPDAPLGEAPDFPLSIPGNTEQSAKGRTYKDLTSHPWAGLEVLLTLVVKDGAGQETRTQPVRIVLPSRTFTKPLAKALVALRQQLIQKPHSNYYHVMHALHELSKAPVKHIKDPRVYLNIRTAFWRLTYNTGRETAKSVANQLWSTALYIEDGNLAEAEQRMKLLQDKLAKRLREGASAKEIEKLLREFRHSVAQFLQSLARNNPGQQNKDLQNQLGSDRTLTPQDLDRMLRNIENLAKSGSREQAAQMLSQLREMLENLRGQSGQQNAQSKAMMNMMKDLGDLIHNQQKLLDDTFRKNKGVKRDGRDGKNQPNPFGELQKRQDAMARLLSQLMERMKQSGFSENEDLNQAQGSMKGAGKALGANKPGRATQLQTLALDKLRKGARSTARQIMRRMQQQVGRRDGRDPFGNRLNGPEAPERGRKIPKPSDTQKARDLLNNLRQRFSDPNRPPIELDYLERLLKKF